MQIALIVLLKIVIFLLNKPQSPSGIEACMQIEKFFGRFSLRAGCMTVAALYTMISVVAILTVHNIGGANVLPKDKLFPLQICTTFVSIVVITFSGLYVLGIKKVSPELMHPCVLLDVIVGFILSFALPFAVVKFYKFDSKVKAACTTVVGLLYLALHAYLWLVILTFYREIKAEAEIADEPNEAEC